MAARKGLTIKMVKIALYQNHGIAAKAAKSLNVDRSAIQHYLDKYPDVREAQLAGRERIIDVAESKLLAAAIKGQKWAVELVIKTLGKKRGYVEKIETDNSGEINFNVKFVDNPTTVS